MTGKRFCITCILALAAGSAASASYTPSDTVTVSWEKGIVAASARYDAAQDERGIPVDYASAGAPVPTAARMDAYGKAREAARELIAYAIRDIKTDGASTVGTLLDADPAAQEQMERTLDEKVVSRESPGGFLEAKCSASIKISDLTAAVPYDYPGAEFPVGQPNPLATEYTSVIIDLRGREMSPMLFPSIYDQDGLEIYGRRYVSAKKACARGLARWCFDEKSARALKIAGEHPFYTAALSALNGSPVVSRADARKILSHRKTREKLKRCAVIFIIDSPGKKKEGAPR